SRGPESVNRSPRRAIVTSSAVSIWRRLASSGPQSEASRALSTGVKATSAVAWRRRGWLLKCAPSHSHPLHGSLERLVQGVEAIGQMRVGLLGQAGPMLRDAQLRDQPTGVFALQRARIRRAATAAREHVGDALHVLALQVAAHERDVAGA